jgi:outer membrane protein OmpA-like peptidoglycan-associated protein
VICAVTPDENQLLLLNTYDPQGRTIGRGLSISKKGALGWEVPQSIRMVNYYNRDLYEEFFLSNDGDVMLLAVKRDDTFGNKDLYVSFKNDEIWTEPINLGQVINSGGREFSPFLASDGRTLYFSSTGHPGFGKNDIFISRRLDESWTNWSKPLNLGMPINSSGRDAYYSVPANGEFAYFVSSKDSYGMNDIYRIALPKEAAPEPVVLVYGNVYNSKDKSPLGAKITYRDIDSKETVGVAQSDPVDGAYKIVLPLKKFYSFFAEKTGFYSVRDNIDLKSVKKQYQEIRRDLYLTPIEFGQTILLNNVFFVRSKAELLDGSYAELDRLVTMLEENSDVAIELSGHTDNVGDPRLNLKLSEERAGRVKAYLVDRGIDSTRIISVGHGGSKPVASNRYENTRRLNRRVEFKILKAGL